jgi:hypothetical protein
MRLQQEQNHKDENQADQRLKLAQDGTGHQPDSQGKAEGRRQREACPTQPALYERQRQFRQPLMHDPMGTRHRPGKRILAGQGPTGQHPVAGGDVQIGIRITQQLLRPIGQQQRHH